MRVVFILALVLVIGPVIQIESQNEEDLPLGSVVTETITQSNSRNYLTLFGFDTNGVVTISIESDFEINVLSRHHKGGLAGSSEFYGKEIFTFIYVYNGGWIRLEIIALEPEDTTYTLSIQINYTTDGIDINGTGFVYLPGSHSFDYSDTRTFYIPTARTLRIIQWGLELDLANGKISNGSGILGYYYPFRYKGGIAITTYLDLDPGNYTFMFTSTARYSPILGITMTSDIDYNEPNDEIANATPIYPEAQEFGFIDRGDADWYVLSAMGERSMYVQFDTPQQSSGIYFRLYQQTDASQDLLVVKPVNQTQSVYTAGNPLLIEVYSDETYGEPVFQDYQLKVSVMIEDGSENDDGSETIVQLSPGGFISGNMHNPTDRDNIAFNLNYYSKVRITVLYDVYPVNITFATDDLMNFTMDQSNRQIISTFEAFPGTYNFTVYTQEILVFEYKVYLEITQTTPPPPSQEETSSRLLRISFDEYSVLIIPILSFLGIWKKRQGI